MKCEVNIIADGLKFPDGPAFDSKGRLWFVELGAGNLARWSVTQNGVRRFSVDGQPNGLAFDAAEMGWVCDAQQNSIRRFDPSKGTHYTVTNSIGCTPLTSPNDLAFDPLGNLVVTCPGNSKTEALGFVVVRRPDGTLIKIAQNMYAPKGLAFVEDGTILVIAEAERQRLWKGRWDPMHAQWINPEPFAEIGGTRSPNGMAVGADGLLYVTVYGVGQIKAFNLNGRVVRTYDLPGKDPTNAAFDPSGKLGLIVTEAQKGQLLSLPSLGPGQAPFDGRPRRQYASNIGFLDLR